MQLEHFLAAFAALMFLRLIFGLGRASGKRAARESRTLQQAIIDVIGAAEKRGIDVTLSVIISRVGHAWGDPLQCLELMIETGRVTVVNPDYVNDFEPRRFTVPKQAQPEEHEGIEEPEEA